MSALAYVAESWCPPEGSPGRYRFGKGAKGGVRGTARGKPRFPSPCFRNPARLHPRFGAWGFHARRPGGRVHLKRRPDASTRRAAQRAGSASARRRTWRVRHHRPPTVRARGAWMALPAGRQRRLTATSGRNGVGLTHLRRGRDLNAPEAHKPALGGQALPATSGPRLPEPPVQPLPSLSRFQKTLSGPGHIIILAIIFSTAKRSECAVARMISPDFIPSSCITKTSWVASVTFP